MTDREKPLEILRKPIFPHELADPTEAVADYLLDNGVTFGEDTNVPSKWIPVTERLPGVPEGWHENSEPVLFIVKGQDKVEAGYYGENGIWRDKYFRTYRDGKNGYDADDVLCWMWQSALPEPPKEE